MLQKSTFAAWCLCFSKPSQHHFRSHLQPWQILWKACIRWDQSGFRWLQLFFLNLFPTSSLQRWNLNSPNMLLKTRSCKENSFRMVLQEVTSPGRELGTSWPITARQHVQVPGGTDSDGVNVLPFLKRGHTGDCIQSTAEPATLRSSGTTLFLEEDAGLLTLVCNFK